MFERHTRTLLAAALLTAGLALPAAADGLTVEMQAVNDDGTGASVGTIAFTDSTYGLLIEPDLAGLPAGLHGLHIHQHPDCGTSTRDDGAVVPGGAAGGHYDPIGAGIHEGPYGEGHLGDLPNLYVAADGTATLVLLAPRVALADLDDRAVMIHVGSDDYTDAHPGGNRGWCGVVVQ